MRLIILGGPGAGKGTHAKIISKNYDIPHISTGDIFRENIKNNTELGKEVGEYLKNGTLVPDSLTLNVIIDRLSQKDCSNGYILDGFPRNINQADALNGMLEDMGTKIDYVVDFHVDDDILIKRMTGRRSCPKCGAGYNMNFDPPKVGEICDKCGAELSKRQDDDEKTVIGRLEVYHKQTEPLIEYYNTKGMLVTVDSSKNIEHTEVQLAKILPGFGKQ